MPSATNRPRAHRPEPRRAAWSRPRDPIPRHSIVTPEHRRPCQRCQHSAPGSRYQTVEASPPDVRSEKAAAGQTQDPGVPVHSDYRPPASALQEDADAKPLEARHRPGTSALLLLHLTRDLRPRLLCSSGPHSKPCCCLVAWSAGRRHSPSGSYVLPGQRALESRRHAGEPTGSVRHNTSPGPGSRVLRGGRARLLSLRRHRSGGRGAAAHLLPAAAQPSSEGEGEADGQEVSEISSF